MVSKLLSKYLRIRSSIYSQVIYIIVILSLLLFVSFAYLFRTTNEKHLQSVIKQCGNRVAYLVEGSLYTSMMENDKDKLKYTLDIMKDMPGIGDVNLYDGNDSLIYSVNTNLESSDSSERCTPDCITCHDSKASILDTNEKQYHVLQPGCNCKTNSEICEHRQLLIISPIKNEPSCYESSCHVHKEEELHLGSLVIKLPLASLDQALRETTFNYFVMASMMTLLLIFVLISFTKRKIYIPLQGIIKASEAVAAGDLNMRLDEGENQLGDMNKVSSAINHMLDKLNKANSELQVWSKQLEYKVHKKSEELKETQNELIHIERMASLGKLSSSVAHEINNPLAGVLTYTKLVQKQLSKQTIPEDKKTSLLSHLNMIEKETKRCGDIVKGLLDFSRKDQQHFEDISIKQVLQESYDLMLHPMKMADISFKMRLHAEYDTVHCSANQIKQACIAILVNAIEAVDENGTIMLSCNEDPHSDFLHIEISDNGAGISEEDLPHIFEPFFSSKQKASGIGLGLSVVHGIVENHKGKVKV
ncbi:hypothetical protein KAJ27_03500, partial [bacterium]|nr:hypothetical protein [bacterium]